MFQDEIEPVVYLLGWEGERELVDLDKLSLNYFLKCRWSSILTIFNDLLSDLLSGIFYHSQIL